MQILTLEQELKKVRAGNAPRADLVAKTVSDCLRERVTRPELLVATPYNIVDNLNMYRKNRPDNIRKQTTREFLQTLDKSCNMTMEDMRSFRVLSGWRITRELGRIRGTLATDECLDESETNGNIEMSHWYMPYYFDHGFTPKKRIYNHFDQVCHLLATANFIPEALQEYYEVNGEMVPREGLAMMPPKIPHGFIGNETKYSEVHDPRLIIFVQLVHSIALGLGLYKDSPELPGLGDFGMRGMTSIETIRDTYPTPADIINLEDLLTEECLSIMITHTAQQAREHFSNVYNLSNHETNMLIRLAKNKAEEGTGTLEEERAFMVARIDHIVQKSIEGTNYNTALRGLRDISEIRGLRNSVDEEESEDLRSVISRAHIDRKKQNSMKELT